MTPQEMAAIHGAAFAPERGWSAAEFADLLAQSYTAAFTAPGGFALTRTLAGESELLTLAVAPPQRRRGVARGLLHSWLDTVRPDAESAFLEVAADNHAALALYTGLGFSRSGLRKSYYSRQSGPAVDALLMTRTFTRG